MAEQHQEEASLPNGIALTALDETYREDLHKVLDRLRTEAPVHEDTELGRIILTRHDDVRGLLRNREWGVDPRKSSADSYVRLITGTNTPEGIENYQPSMLFLDDPDHKRLRALVSQAFNPRAIENMRARTHEITSALLDEMAGRDEIDFIAEFAGPLPTLVIADMLGVALEDRNDFKRWSDDLIFGFDPIRDDETNKRIEASGEAMRAYFDKTIAARRANPKDDLISDLVRAQEAEDSLNDEEIMSMCTLLLIAGNVTTTDLIGNGLYALLTHPDQMEKLKADPSLIENAIEEILRFDSPVTDSARLPFSDEVIDGCPIKKGYTTYTSLAAANHDPSVYPEPHKFDIEREDTHHQSFGGGIHMCLGAPLARLEAQIGMNAFLARFPNVHLSDTPGKRRHLPSFRGFETLPIRL
ncbi:cytochrome P450 [Parvibaculaceae bacterium PLY_AMNH_Bact1]|nr:cytochrome P450 [Parvibaculaceae bacterium PLY_AMNH_Bact1]